MQVCPKQGWVYYSSGADDEITLRENHNAFHRIWMRSVPHEYRRFRWPTNVTFCRVFCDARCAGFLRIVGFI